MSEDHSNPVELWIYDLSRGVAVVMSQLLIGKKIDGIWHTSIVVYGKEYFFGSQGISSCFPGEVINEPVKKEVLGQTQIPYSIFIDYLTGLGESTYHGSTYDLFSHNCNNFSEEIAQFLCGVGIPRYILELPDEVLNTPLGQQLRPLLEITIKGPNSAPQPIRERSPSPGLQRLNQQIEETRIKSLQLKEKRNNLHEKLAKRERKKEKKRRKQLKERGYSVEEFEENWSTYKRMAESDVSVPAPEETRSSEPNERPEISSEIVRELEEEELREREERKKNREPPIIFKDAVNIQVEFDALVGLVDGKLNEEEQHSLEELHQYMLEDEGSWALGENFLGFIGRLLHDKSLPVEVRVRTLNVLALAALKDDVILLLHQDRREHIIMNYAYDIDRSPVEEQEALALFICNLFENLSSSEWLLYISEWTFCNNSISNIRVTTKVAVHSLLSDRPTLQEKGVAIIHNLACKEVKTVVFDDVAVELTMAVLQFFQSKPSEDQLFNCMKALARFTQISGQEVPQLIQMIGPDPRSFKGINERIDEQIALVAKKLR
ncbi:uncharacterized protein LOC123295236 isoform X2 [Chrysoperla carnea]|uniref:uncharacterized protein LOC123295236 isoform X2 n=1 Tax=Chrysoperla carnea TaxID=189513 RepID=UPI001D07FF51|nr:uncharacterized protein LOC123295236 isoform X2 [Chrysoperla carnea]